MQATTISGRRTKHQKPLTVSMLELLNGKMNVKNIGRAITDMAGPKEPVEICRRKPRFINAEAIGVATKLLPNFLF